MQFYFDKGDKDYVDTSCGQLCFFKWCFENNIIDYVLKYYDEINIDMNNNYKSPKKKSKLKNKI
jgi:hypothetical protein